MVVLAPADDGDFSRAGHCVLESWHGVFLAVGGEPDRSMQAPTDDLRVGAGELGSEDDGARERRWGLVGRERLAEREGFEPSKGF
jgi:hypothetical protein